MSASAIRKSTRFNATAPDGTKLLMDVWLAEPRKADALRPAIVKVHGGGWVMGARSENRSWNIFFNQLGYHVFDIDYRMPPRQRWKDEVADVKCALGWVAANAAKYGVDPKRVSMFGFSAGGNLAMLAAYSTGHPQLPSSCNGENIPVRSVINLSGPADLTLFYRKRFSDPTALTS
jgi:acetyl esterase/lipase